MNKILLWLGIAMPVYATLLITVLTGVLALLLMALLTFIAGIAFTQTYRSLAPDVPAEVQRRLNAYAIGLGVALSLLAILGVFASVPLTTEGGIDTESLQRALSVPFVVSLGLFLPAALLVYHWREYEPEWLTYVLAGVLFIGLLSVMMLDEAAFGGLQPAAILPALLCLGAAAPAILQLREGQTA